MIHIIHVLQFTLNIGFCTVLHQSLKSIHPLYKVVIFYIYVCFVFVFFCLCVCVCVCNVLKKGMCVFLWCVEQTTTITKKCVYYFAPNREWASEWARAERNTPNYQLLLLCCLWFFNNDPSADSSTDTLLRLLLPLIKKIWKSSPLTCVGAPSASPFLSIGRSDGRCVQRPVT